VEKPNGEKQTRRQAGRTPTLRDKARQATYPRQRLEASGLPALSHAHRETSTFITIRQMRQQLFACRADN